MTAPVSSMIDRAERLAWLTLKLIPELGNRSLLRLIRHFKTAEDVLNAGVEALEAVAGLRTGAVEALRKRDLKRSAAGEWEELKRRGIRMVCLSDLDYPANLAQIADPPAVLFIQGTFEPRDLVAVAVVGSRAASSTGLLFTEKLCADLAQSGVTVVSGFAMGIDGAAHRGALRGRGRTLAVLGCGLDVDYPQGHGKLRMAIPGSGALISEFPLGTPPAPGHFPQRNRIISGLALGVVVVEAAERSGSLITARLALEQGREVFAVPGMARHYRSVGPHRLLKEGAKLVESAEDILEEIRSLIRPSWQPLTCAPGTSKDFRKKEAPGEFPSAALPEAPASGIGPLGDRERTLLDLLDETPRHIDEICRALPWPVAQVAVGLLALELKGLVKQLPGKHFVGIRSPLT